MEVDTCDQLRSMHLACFRAVHSVEATEAEVVIEGKGDSSPQLAAVAFLT